MGCIIIRQSPSLMGKEVVGTFLLGQLAMERRGRAEVAFENMTIQIVLMRSEGEEVESLRLEVELEEGNTKRVGRLDSTTRRLIGIHIALLSLLLTENKGGNGRRRLKSHLYRPSWVLHPFRRGRRDFSAIGLSPI